MIVMSEITSSQSICPVCRFLFQCILFTCVVLSSQDSVVLGGTHDKDQWDTIPRKEDAKFILEGCTSLFPSLEVIDKHTVTT